MDVHNKFGVLAVIALLCLSEISQSATTTTSFLSASERSRLFQVFQSAIDVNDLGATYYAVLGLKSQAASVPNEKEICKALLAAAGNANIETIFYVTGSWKALGNCPGTLPSANLIKSISAVVDKEASSATDVYHAISSLDSLGQKLPDSAKIIKNLQTALKKDDSIASLGHAFHVAARLGGDVTPIFSRIEDAVVQADEVDGRYLQFEGGLSITALVVSGAYRLATAANKAPPISNEQAVKFANYFLSRRSVQTSKGAHSLLDVLTLLTNNKYHVPVVVSLAGPGVVSSEQPKVSVRVTNLLGQPVAADAAFNVLAESATRTADDVVVLSKKKFELTSDKTVFSVNIMDAKPDPGVYRLAVSAAPTKADARLVGNLGVALPLKVTCAAAIDSFEIGVGDSDQTTQPKFDKVVFPTKLGRVLEVDSQQKLVARFGVKDKSSGRPLQVHQAFLRFHNHATGQEIVFVADHDPATNGYRADLDIGAKGADFGQQSGVYSLHLIVGDFILTNSFSWQLADVRLKLAHDGAAPSSHTSIYAPKPEIKHLFREPEKRPPAVVSTFFTGLVGLPFLVLLVLWAKIGVNISNFPFSLAAIGFHLGLGGIFSLFGLFFLELNMFQTLKYLLGLGVVTFLCGNKLLARIAANRKKGQ